MNDLETELSPEANKVVQEIREITRKLIQNKYIGHLKDSISQETRNIKLECSSEYLDLKVLQTIIKDQNVFYHVLIELFNKGLIVIEKYEIE
jgi:hypothetical protein